MKRVHLFALWMATSYFFLPAQDRVQSEIKNGLKHYQSQIFFEENKGQFNSAIRFQSFVTDMQLRFLENGTSIAMVRELEEEPSNTPKPEKYQNYQWMGEKEAEHEALVWNLQFLQANPNVQVEGREAFQGKVHYLKGNDSTRWAKHIQRFKELWYVGLYDGIDLRYYGTDRQKMEYDFILMAHANVRSIRLGLNGPDKISLNPKGELVIHTQWGQVVEGKPYAYQLVDGMEKEVAVRYRINGENEYGFDIVGEYDASLPLVIDPLTLNWASFFHSSGSDDYVMANVLDDDGYVYIAGYTKSLTFPITPGVFQNVYGGGIDCYVAKLTPLGTNLVYSTYLGGNDWELVYGMDLNNLKQAVVAGFARSPDFPTSPGAFQSVAPGGMVEGFVARLTADGSGIIFSTYLGGTDRDYLYDIKVSNFGLVYVCGYTLSADFPVTPTSFEPSYVGNGDGFVTCLRGDGSGLVYSTFLGGSNYDIINSLDVSNFGHVFVTGNTGSTDFPVTPGAYQTSLATGGGTPEDMFVCRLNPMGSNLIYSTYVGGGDADGGYCLSLNNANEAFVSGITYSPDFPVTPGAFMDGSSGGLGNGDAFVLRLSANGSAMQYATYLGGSDIEFGKAIQVNNNNEAYVLGASRSANFPISPSSNPHDNMYDVFLTVLRPDGTGMLQSAFYGGTYNDYPRAPGSLYMIDNFRVSLVATTHSPNMSMTAGTYQVSKTNGVADAPWVASIELGTVLPIVIEDFSAEWVDEQEWVDLSWTVWGQQEQAEYDIERSYVDQDWESLGTLKTDQSGFQRYYEFTDLEAGRIKGNKLFYRIKSTGPDGSVYTSRIVEVQAGFHSGLNVSLSPNPARTFSHLNLQLPPNEQVYFEILNAEAKVVYTSRTFVSGAFPTAYHPKLDVQNYAAGVYIVRVYGSNGSPINQKLIVKR